jgi:hypothetical protein
MRHPNPPPPFALSVRFQRQSKATRFCFSVDKNVQSYSATRPLGPRPWTGQATRGHPPHSRLTTTVALRGWFFPCDTCLTNTKAARCFSEIAPPRQRRPSTARSRCSGPTRSARNSLRRAKPAFHLVGGRGRLPFP